MTEQPQPSRRSFLQGILAAACSACLPTVVKAVTPQLVVPTKTLILYGPGMYTVPLTDIVIDNKYNARMSAPHESDMDLMRSIREVGLINPLVCTVTTPGDKVMLVSGFRRWHCMAALGPRWPGYFKVPVHVRDYNEEQIHIHNLIESTPRVEMSREDEHRALNKLHASLTADGMSSQDAVKQIANVLGRSEKHIRFRMKTDMSYMAYYDNRNTI
jgi:uncharacterized protein YoaH (UPF0181 family)